MSFQGIKVIGSLRGFINIQPKSRFASVNGTMRQGERIHAGKPRVEDQTDDGMIIPPIGNSSRAMVPWPANGSV